MRGEDEQRVSSRKVPELHSILTLQTLRCLGSLLYRIFDPIYHFSTTQRGSPTVIVAIAVIVHITVIFLMIVHVLEFHHWNLGYTIKTR